MKINTLVLQNILTKAMKGVANLSLLPLTSMLGIISKDGELTITSTNGGDFLSVIDRSGNYDEEFDVTVDANRFNKLVSKTTASEIEIKIIDNTLVLKGNGKYTLSLYLNEEGKLLSMPSHTIEEKKNYKVSKDSIKLVLRANKSCIDKKLTTSVNCYSGYYFDNKGVVTTDSYTICSLDRKLVDTPILLHSETMDLLSTLDGDEIIVNEDDEHITFYDGDVYIFGNKMSNIKEFDISSVRNLLEEELPSEIEIDKYLLSSSLDRISVLVDKYDNGMIELSFNKDGLHISNKAKTSEEIIDYEDNKLKDEFTNLINIEKLIAQIKTYQGTKINILFGNETSIKLVDGDVTKIVALGE